MAKILDMRGKQPGLILQSGCCVSISTTIHGIDVALPVLRQSLEHIGADENAFAIYQRGSEMLAKDNRLGDAIKLLEKGIGVASANLFSLYQ